MSASERDQIAARRHVRAYLGEVGRDDGAVGKLATGQSAQGLGCELGRLELDENLAHTSRLPATSDRPRDLDGEDGAELLALLLNVVADFWKRVSAKP